jgi:beta-glucosidase
VNDQQAPAPLNQQEMAKRVSTIVQAMTLSEKIGMVHGAIGRKLAGYTPPEGSRGCGGFVRGVPRLGIPDLHETDAAMGITNPYNVRPGDGATALPSTLAMAATWNPSLAFENGTVLGNEARYKGFNVVLAGGANLVREPRSGRNFECPGEDPLLAGQICGSAVAGIQSQKVASTVKHYALNNLETGRFEVDVQIDPAAARESDLLAFQIAIEKGQPASVMASYNLVNGHYASENDWLLNQVLKRDWQYPGWVMSDWGGTHSTESALHGLDQQSGEQLDEQVYLGDDLAAKVKTDPAYAARLDDMVYRIIRSLMACGVFDDPVKAGEIDYAQHARISQRCAEEACVLLKNEHDLLPLKDIKRIAIIGGMAEFGVLAGGGSSYTAAIEGPGIQLPAMGIHQAGGAPRMMIYHPSSPAAALKELLPDVQFELNSGSYPRAAARAAQLCDVAIVFATQWTTENADAPDLSLPSGQDEMIAAVAAANPRTVVVLETGGPVMMPWLNQVSTVLAAWYPGGRGGQAIANILTGQVSPSGRLPVTFPAAIEQLPRPEIVGYGILKGRPPKGTQATPLPYEEGADVGYRCFAKKAMKPLFPFGFGLSYSRFEYSDLSIEDGEILQVGLTVTNTGQRSAMEVAQIYLVSMPDESEFRLLGWKKIALDAGQSISFTVRVDPRLLSKFDVQENSWVRAKGAFKIAAGSSSADLHLHGIAQMSAWQTKA